MRRHAWFHTVMGQCARSAALQSRKVLPVSTTQASSKETSAVERFDSVILSVGGLMNGKNLLIDIPLE